MNFLYIKINLVLSFFNMIAINIPRISASLKKSQAPRSIDESSCINQREKHSNSNESYHHSPIFEHIKEILISSQKSSEKKVKFNDTSLPLKEKPSIELEPFISVFDLEKKIYKTINKKADQISALHSVTLPYLEENEKLIKYAIYGDVSASISQSVLKKPN